MSSGQRLDELPEADSLDVADLLYVLDVSDPTRTPEGTPKKITASMAFGIGVPWYPPDLPDFGSDFAPQYLLLAGRSGGQIAHGGTGASQSLTLRGTSHATRGPINLGAAYPDHISRVNILHDNTAFGASGLMIKNEPGGTAVVIQCLGSSNKLYMTTTGGAGVPLVISSLESPADGSLFNLGSGVQYSSGGGTYGVSFGINKVPIFRVHVHEVTSQTVAAPTVMVIDVESTGTPGDFFGCNRLIRLESSTTQEREAMIETVQWEDATDATRASSWQMGVYYAGSGQYGLQVQADSGGVQLGFFGGGPGPQPAAITQDYTDTSRNVDSYTADDQSSAYSGIDNAQAGDVYAQVDDLNTLRTAYENLRALAENIAQVLNSVIDDLQSLGLEQE